MTEVVAAIKNCNNRSAVAQAARSARNDIKFLIGDLALLAVGVENFFKRLVGGFDIFCFCKSL